LALIARLAYVLPRETLIDDVYITLRYALNVLHGEGMVFNPGEPVYGASSPLYTLLLSGIALVLSREVLVVILPWMGTLCLAGFVSLVWSLLPITLFARIVMTMALLSYPRIFYASTGGMEECLILLFMGLSVFAHLRGRPVVLGLMCGLLFITKVDTLVWITCILVLEAIVRKKVPWSALAIAFLVSLPWLAYSLSRYGTIIPHTVDAKRVAYVASEGSRLLDAVQFTVPAPFQGNAAVLILFAVGVYGVLGAAIVRAARKKEFLFLLFPIYCLGYTILLLFSGTSSGLWERWTVPHWGMFLLTLGYVVNPVGLIQGLRRGDGLKQGVWIGLALLYLCGLAASFVYPYRMSPDPKASSQAGQWLRAHGAPGESVMLEPIGLIGYLSNLYVHDFIGLVSPRVTEGRKATPSSNRWFTRYLKEREPTFIVLRAREIGRNEFLYGGYGDSVFLPAEKEWFALAYGLTFQTTDGESEEQLVVYVKRNRAGPPRVFSPSP